MATFRLNAPVYTKEEIESQGLGFLSSMAVAVPRVSGEGYYVLSDVIGELLDRVQRLEKQIEDDRWSNADPRGY